MATLLHPAHAIVAWLCWQHSNFTSQWAWKGVGASQRSCFVTFWLALRLKVVLWRCDLKPVAVSQYIKMSYIRSVWPEVCRLGRCPAVQVSAILPSSALPSSPRGNVYFAKHNLTPSVAKWDLSNLSFSEPLNTLLPVRRWGGNERWFISVHPLPGHITGNLLR